MFTPHLDTGDHVIVVNADKVRITSKKSEEKIYYRHSGYPGGIKAESFNALLERRPEAVIERAIKGMLPKNRLGRAIYRKLHVYAGDAHPHESQKPEALTLDVKKVDG
jgi:large subunit ribosomal protein L13